MGRIDDLPTLDRPREKCLRYGVKSLSDEELLAIIIGSGYKGKNAKEIASELLAKENGLLNLSNITYSSLLSNNGINKVTGLKLIAIFEINQRLIQKMMESNENIIDSEYLYNKYKNRFLDTYNEYLIVVCLNRKKKILHETILSIGDDEKIAAKPKDIIRVLLDYNASYFYLIHNHPSGLSSPSDDDMLFTLNISKKVRPLHIKMLDHIIIGKDDYYSFIKEIEL